jgi:hypothetical protein
LREYVDSIYPVMSDIRATAQTSETLSESDRQNLARMLGEFNDEIEKFKSDWSHIFDDS